MEIPGFVPGVPWEGGPGHRAGGGPGAVGEGKGETVGVGGRQGGASARGWLKDEGGGGRGGLTTL